MPLNQSNANDQITAGTPAAEKVVTTDKDNQVTGLDLVSPKIDGTAVTSSGAELNKLDGVTSTPAELNLVDNQVAGATIVVGADAGTTVAVTIQFTDAAGADMATPVAVPWYYATDALGLDAMTVAHDGGTAIGVDGALIESVDNLSGLIISEADGDADIVATDAGAFTSYLVLVMPNGSLVVSAVMTHDA